MIEIPITALPLIICAIGTGISIIMMFLAPGPSGSIPYAKAAGFVIGMLISAILFAGAH